MLLLLGMASERNVLRVIPAKKGGGANWIVEHDPQNPPDIVFDTNVWISMNNNDMDSLKKLESNRGFRYRYSVTNYCELVSHLEDEPSRSCREPFVKYRQCLRRIVKVCHHDVLPSPEMELLALVGLESYLNPAWIPNQKQTALAVELIGNADSLAEVRGDLPSNSSQIPRYVVKPGHYRNLRDTDSNSFCKIMELLDRIDPPIRGSDKEKMNALTNWFLILANFFFLIRASGQKVHFNKLPKNEANQFLEAFMQGAGRLFQAHCVTIAKKRINEKRRIDPNDLYDAMQLLYLQDENRIFVTADKFFHLYEIDPEIQRVIPWGAFRNSS